MASPNYYPNGVGGTTGAELATLKHLYVSSNVMYLDYTTGSDAAGYGAERNKPYKTLAYALAALNPYGTLVVLAGSNETITVQVVNADDGITIIGEGTGSQRPKFTCGYDGDMLNLTGADVTLDNLYFPASTVQRTAGDGKMQLEGEHLHINNCYFECGGHDELPQIVLSGTARIENTTFISTATSVTDQPLNAIDCSVMTFVEMDRVTFDGGSSGWSDPYAFKGTGAITSLRATNIDLLHDSDVSLATGTYGIFQVRNTSGSARVVWAA